MRNFLIGLAVANMRALGFELQARDTNKSGADDGIGILLSAAAPALETFALSNGDESKVKIALKAAADTIYTFLGLTPVQG